MVALGVDGPIVHVCARSRGTGVDDDLVRDLRCGLDIHSVERAVQRSRSTLFWPVKVAV